MAVREQSVGYFERHAERLVLDGARLWQLGNRTGEARHFRNARRLYHDILGQMRATPVLGELAVFVAALGRCASCPLKAHMPGENHVTSDEVLLLGLIAGVQHGDDPLVGTCLDGLTCPARCDELAHSAARFAVTLRAHGHLLRPIPVAAVHDVLIRAGRRTLQ